MKTNIRWILPLLAMIMTLLSAPALVAGDIEIVQLRNRVADDVLPQLHAFVEPGGTLNGMNDKLFIKTSPRNRAQLLELIAAMDVPVRRLLISVSREDERESGGNIHSGTVTLGSSKVGASGTAQSYSTRQLRSGSGRQQVQTIDGGRATLLAGERVVLPWRQVRLGPDGRTVLEGTVMREISNGFVAVPHVSGQRVTVDIEPAQETWTGQPGSSSGLRLSATVSGRLGEWIMVGSTGTADAGQGGSGGQYGVRSSREAQRFMLKVDELQ